MRDPMEQGVCFGSYRFDARSGQLWSGSREIRLTPKASAVLKVLVAHAGEPVSKDDLFAAVWTGTAVSDDALTSCIQELRRALEDDSKQPRFIETRHRRGYRFVAALSEVAPRQAAGGVAPGGQVSTPAAFRQHVRYVEASDGTRLAWAESGSGPVVFKAANWLTHLEYEWDSPVWRHWIQFFSAHSRFVRYDERGCGMSEWQGSLLSLDQWVADLESIIDAALPESPVTLLGISQGAVACIRYAIRYPERVARMILYGGYARGGLLRGSPETRLAYRAMIDLARVAWGKENPTFRQVFTSRFIPGGTREQLQWFNDLCLKTTTGEIVAELLEARGVVDITESLAEVRTPTLVLHARHDEVIPIAEARLLASGIPRSEFVELDSRNHILLEHEPAWQRFREAVLDFMRPGPAGTADRVRASAGSQ